MSLKTHGSYLKAFLADPLAWADYGGYERVAISINNQVPCADWSILDFQESDEVEVISGHRLDNRGHRMGCFVASMSAWLMEHQSAQVRVELPSSDCLKLQAWALEIGARCSQPEPVPALAG